MKQENKMASEVDKNNFEREEKVVEFGHEWEELLKILEKEGAIKNENREKDNKTDKETEKEGVESFRDIQ